MKSGKKSLAVNSIYSVIYKLMSVFFPLITATYAARIILADGVGKAVYAENIAQYFVLIAALGIPNYGIREIAKLQDDKKGTDRMFSELFLLNAFSTIICSAVYYSWIMFSPLFENSRLLYAVAGMKLLFNIINVDWFYYGKEEYKFVAIRSFLVRLVCLVLMFVLVRDVDDFIMFALVHSISICGNHIINIISLKGRVRLTFSGIDIRPHLKPVFILLASSISIEIYTMLDTTMLGFWCSDEVVGYYNNAVKLAKLINTTIVSIAAVLLPRLSYFYRIGDNEKLKEVANRVLKILITLVIPAAAGVFLLSEDIILILFGADFAPAAVTLQILTLIIIVISLSNFFGIQILMTFGQERKLLISVAVGAVVNVIFNYFLIQSWQQNGAAVASVISEVCVLAATVIFARQYVSISMKARFWITLIVSCALMCAGVYAVTLLHMGRVAELIVGVAAGCMIFGCAGLLLKNEGVVEICSVGKNLIAGKLHRK